MGPAGPFVPARARPPSRPAGPVDAVAYSPDGKSFVSGDWGGKVTVRDARPAQCDSQVPHGQYVHAVAYSPDGRQIATGSSDHTIRILDAAERRGQLDQHLTGPHRRRLSACDSRPMAGNFSAARTTTRPAYGMSPPANCCRYFKRPQLVGLGGRVLAGRKPHRHRRPGWQGDRVAKGSVSTSEQRQPPSPQPPSHPALRSTSTNSPATTAPCTRPASRPKGELVATGGYDKLVMIWNPDEVKPVDIAKLARRRARTRSRTTCDWPATTGRCDASRSRRTASSSSAAAKTTRSACGMSPPAKPVKTLRGHGSTVRSCCLSPDGQWSFPAATTSSVRLWNIARLSGSPRAARHGILRPRRRGALGPLFSRWQADRHRQPRSHRQPVGRANRRAAARVPGRSRVSRYPAPRSFPTASAWPRARATIRSASGTSRRHAVSRAHAHRPHRHAGRLAGWGLVVTGSPATTSRSGMHDSGKLVAHAQRPRCRSLGACVLARWRAAGQRR